jgi:nucleotide-binding universal stress UspA family protein
MTTLFNNILVPADLTLNTEIAIKKALEIAEHGATIHLLHIYNFRFWLGGFIGNRQKTVSPAETEKYLPQWRKAIEESDKELKACVWTTSSESVQKAIEKLARRIAVDLIIIGKQTHHSWMTLREKVTCSKLVQNTGIAVLAVKPGSFHNKARKLIVPLESEVPLEKMKMITGMSKKYRLRVHLVSFVAANESNPSLYAASLLHTRRWLSSSIGCPVEYTVLNRPGSSRALLDYTRKNEGNILLVFAGMETDLGLMRRDIADVVRPHSNIEILTIKKQAAVVN